MSTLIHIEAFSSETGLLEPSFHGATGEISYYERIWEHLRDLVETVAFPVISLNDGGNMQVGPETLKPSTLLLNESGVEWSPERRRRHGPRFLERSEQLFALVLEFASWVDLDRLDQRLEDISAIRVTGDAENGIENRFLVVRSRDASHPKTDQATSGTRVTYELAAVPYL